MRERWTPVYDRMFDPEHHLADGEPACRRWAWLEMVHMAQYEKKDRIIGGTVIPLGRGEFVASLRFLAQKFGWSVKKVRTFLEILTDPAVNKLETVRETPKGTVYRVVSYGVYANPGHTKGHDRGTGGAQVGHKEQQVTSYQAGNHSAREDEISELLPEHPAAAQVIRSLRCPGGITAKVASLRTKFLYPDGKVGALPEDSVSGKPLEERKSLVAAALLDMQDNGVDEWGTRILDGYIRGLGRNNDRTNRRRASGEAGSEESDNPLGDPSRRSNWGFDEDAA